MAGITHEWDGTVLTVTSDAGTSSANLQGLKGDVGPRGPQGPAGVIYNEDGELLLDLSKYPTYEDMDSTLSNYPTETEVATTLDNYATKNYVSIEIANAQLEGAEVDVSNLVTKDELEEAIGEASNNTKVDGMTILQRADGTIYTAIGGSVQEGAMHHLAAGLQYIPRHYISGGSTYTKSPLTNTGKPFTEGVYSIKVIFQDGFVEEREVYCQKEGSEYGWMEYYNGGQPQRLSYFGGDATTGDIFVETRSYDCVIVSIEISKGGYTCIDPNFIPVDGSTIYVNEAGQLACTVSIGEDGVDLSNFYTKGQIDFMLSNLSTGDIPSSEEVSY